MKVLFLSAWYPTRLDIANGIFVQRHAEAAALYHHVEVLHALADPGLKQNFEVTEETINGLRTVIVYHKKKKFPGHNFLMRMRAYHKGFQILSHPEVVHGNILDSPMMFACWLKWRFQIPFIISEHWSGFLKINRNRLSASRKKLAKFLSRQASAVLPVSQVLAEDLIHAGVGNVKRSIGNVVDTELFSLKSQPNSENFTFLHLSSLLPLKNPEKIIRAAVILHQELPYIRLVIGGEGNIQPFKELVNSVFAEDFITVVGWQNPEQVAALMQKSNAFVLFSDYENFPCVLLESLSTGIPVIAPAVGGIPEIIIPENGFLIEKSEAALYAAMRRMAMGEITFSPKKMRQTIVENYSREVIGRKFSAEYAQALKKNPV